MNTITVNELKNKIDRHEPINLIDVREPQEIAESGAIAGSRLMPVGQIQSMQVEEIEHLKEEPVYVYCRSGRRSMMACMVLNQLGFTNTFNVEGGYLAWQEANKQ